MIQGKGKTLYSASDLITFLSCRHASFLDVKSLNEEIATTKSDPMAQRLQKKGLEHEVDYLELMRREHTVVEISKDCGLQERVKRTIQAMESGADVIYQGVLLSAPWRGDADFLIKCETPSKLGDHSYEVLDAKLSKYEAPKHIVQLCVYSELLMDIQGVRPKKMHLFFRG